ncbi:MAG: hypothetical protein V7459_14205 [Oceanicoccus sp.]
MSKKSNRTNIFVGIATSVIVAASFSLLFLTKTSGEPVTFFARSIDDASYDCEDKIVSKYGNRLISKSFDNLSSRYQREERQYLIYYQISIRESNANYPAIDDHLVKCTVWERLGYVSDFRIID